MPLFQLKPNAHVKAGFRRSVGERVIVWGKAHDVQQVTEEEAKVLRVGHANLVEVSEVAGDKGKYKPIEPPRAAAEAKSEAPDKETKPPAKETKPAEQPAAKKK